MNKQQLEDYEDGERTFGFDEAVNRIVDLYKGKLKGKLNKEEINMLVEHIKYRILFFEGYITRGQFIKLVTEGGDKK